MAESPEEKKKQGFKFTHLVALIAIFVTAIIATPIIAYTLAGAYISLTKEEKLSSDLKYLKDFRTVSVEVIFPSPDLKDVIGYNEEQLSNIAEERFCSQFAVSFTSSGITCGVNRRPYSFQENPLNLIISFEVYKYANKPQIEFSINPVILRSYYFASLLSREEEKSGADECNKLRAEKGSLVTPFQTDLKLNKRRPGGPTRLFKNMKDFHAELDFLAGAILEKVEPNQKFAAELEEQLKACQ
jgi:hypothetical protein